VPSNVLRILTKYVTRKHADDVPIGILIEQKKLKENIFKSIFEKFTMGKKLNQYNELKEMEDLRHKLTQREMFSKE